MKLDVFRFKNYHIFTYHHILNTAISYQIKFREKNWMIKKSPRKLTTDKNTPYLMNYPNINPKYLFYHQYPDLI